MGEYRTSLRFNEQHGVATISSNLNGLFGLNSRSQGSRRRRIQPGTNGTIDSISIVSAAPSGTVNAFIKQTPAERSHFLNEISSSLPNLRRLLELQQQHKQQPSPSRAMKPQSRLYLQPFGFGELATPPSSASPRPGGGTPAINRRLNNENKLQAVNRSLVKSRHLAMRNTCDLETQQEERIRAELMTHRRHSLDLTRRVQEHLKAENRPTRGLFYEMIFSKRLDKSRQKIRENQFGVIDALSSESDTFYGDSNQDALSAGRSVLKKPPGDEHTRFETPTRIALSIAKQLDPERSLQVGVNGRVFTTSPISSGWSSASTPVSTANQNSRQGTKKRVEIRL